MSIFQGDNESGLTGKSLGEAFAEAADDTGASLQAVTVTDQNTANFVFDIPGQSSITYNVRLAGPDANDFKFVKKGDDDVEIVSRYVLDSKSPQDANQDNIYEVTIEIGTDDARVSNDDDLKEVTLTRHVKVTDVEEEQEQADVQADSPNNSVRHIAVNENEQLIVELDVPAPESGLHQNMITGSDADDVRIREGEDGLILEFVTAPDYEGPQDADGDNIYEFAFAGDLAALMPVEFEVTVVNVAEM